jgi:hypothetical protein
MTTSTLSRSRVSRWIALAGGAAMLIFANSGRSNGVSAASDDPVSVTFSVLSTGDSCYGSASFDVSIAGTAVGNISNAQGGSDCSCGPLPIRTFTTTDPAALALVGAQACTTFGVKINGTAYLSWAKATVTRSISGAQTSCIYGNCGYGGNGGNNLCNAGYQLLTGNSFTGGGFNATNECTAPLTVKTVPWLGSPTTAHPVYSGGKLMLQGVATYGAGDAPMALTSATWDPGDGSGAQPISVANSLALELEHVYTGADGTPYTAVLSVTSASGQTSTANFKVVVKNKTLDIEADMAIDRGLWYLHKRFTRNVTSGVDTGYEQFGTSNYASTASAIQAFEVNNHLEAGHGEIDPYVADVSRGLAFLQSALTVQAIGAQPAGNPDTNGNGIGLFANDNSEDYIVGHLIDAFVASGTPAATARLGNPSVLGRTYKDIVQDMVDYNAWAQIDTGVAGRGGWDYHPNNAQHGAGFADNSVSQWPAIGNIAAERVWGVTVPAFVKTENQIWLNNSQTLIPSDPNDGMFPYDSPGDCPWSECQSTTPSGLVQAIMDGAHYDPAATSGPDNNFLRGVQFIARKMRQHNNFPGGALAGSGVDTNFGGQNLYTLYATTKAMRLALAPDATPTPITTIDDDPTDTLPAFNWYSNDPTNGDPGPYGVARSLVATQQADGHWIGTSNWVDPLSTEYAIIILSPTVFQIGPTAACQANPTEIGSLAPGAVNFTTTGTIENNPNATITSYHWDFGDSSTGSGSSAAHTYGLFGSYPHTYNATLIVTDSNGITDTTTCPVTQIDTNVKPNANPGGNAGFGEYAICQGDPIILDGSGSNDPEDGAVTSFAWDVTNPLTFTPADATTPTFNVTSLFPAPGVYDFGLQVTDSGGKTDAKFGHITVKAATDPSCNQPPVAVDDTATTFSGTPVTIGVLANDTDPDVPAQTLTVTATTQGANGSVTTDGTTATYTPVAGFAGTDTFTYTISDGHGGTATATVTVIVTKRVVTVTASSASVLYGDPVPAVTPSYSGFFGTDTVAVLTTTPTCTTAYTPTSGVGSTPSTSCAGAAALNYTFNYVAGTVTVGSRSLTVTASNASVTYGDPVPTITASYAGFVNGETEAALTPAATCTTAYTPTSAAGSTPATSCAGAGSSNYTFTYVPGTVTIAQKTATVTAGGGAKVYGQSDPALSPATEIGFTVADAAAIALSSTRDGGEAVGNYATHASASGAPLGNYHVTYVPGSFSITPATVTVTAGGGTKVYGSADPALSATTETGLTAADVAGVTLSSSRAAGEPVGNYATTAVASGAVLSNYTVAYVAGNFSITRAPLTVTADSKTGPHGVMFPAFTASYATFVNGDTPASLGGTLTFTTTASAASPAGDYPITPAGLTSPNYLITFVPGVLHLTNEPPVAVNDAYTTQWNTVLTVPAPGVKVNDSDPNNDPLTAIKVTDPAHGTVTLNADGSLTYKPTANYSGADSFTYKVNDSWLDSNIATVQFTISSPCRMDDDDDRGNGHHNGDGDDHDRGRNGHHDGDGCEHDRNTHRHDHDDRNKMDWDDCKPGTPASHSDKYQTLKNTALTVAVAKGVLKNDGRYAATAELYIAPLHGTVALAANGALVYTPAANFVGIDVFYYVPRSAAGVAGAVTSVTIKVSGHFDGDNDDHDRKRNGHRDGDGCEHDQARHGDDGDRDRGRDR